MADELILLDFWTSPFAQRVKIALAEKGIGFETKEENLMNKSPLLLKMNPVKKQIPVLIHNGKPICESLIIVQYIDELWNDKFPLFPCDPYKRANARFWADYIDKKVSTGIHQALQTQHPVKKQIPVLIHNGKPICESLIIVQYIDELWNDKSPLFLCNPYKRANARFWADYIDKRIYSIGRNIAFTKGETHEAAKKDLIECFTLLEAELGEKPYFGGETFGFVDIALIPFYSWFHVYETCGNLSMEEECPKIVAWGKRCMEKECVSKSVPDQYKLFDFFQEMAKKFGFSMNT